MKRIKLTALLTAAFYAVFSFSQALADFSFSDTRFQNVLTTENLDAIIEEYELYEDFTGMVKVIYVRPRKKDVNPSCESSPIRTQPIVTEHNSVNKDKIQNWAYLYDINDFLEKLANMALPEDWKFGNGLPPYPNYPILWSYIKLTFCRLQRQNKVAYSIDSEYAAFNTGLVDYRYMPIIALFKRNFPSKKSQWVFYDFVISEMEAIKNLLPDDASIKSRATKGAALAVEARAALYAGSIAKYGSSRTPTVKTNGYEVGIPADMAQGYYTKALAAAQEIINGKKYMK